MCYNERMKILIDADGCPVVNITLQTAVEYHLKTMLFCDTSHEFRHQNVPVVTVDKGSDSADFALLNEVAPGDIVVTQDYGLAAMVLAKRGLPITQNGKRITNDNIDVLLLTRHAAKKARQGGYRLKGPSKRTREQNQAFQIALRRLIEDAHPHCTG